MHKRIITSPEVKLNAYSSSIYFDGRLYIIGGGLSDKIYKIDFILFKMVEVATMNRRRTEHCSILLDNFILIFGGCDKGNEEILSSCERFNLQTGKIEQMPSMIHPKCGFSICHLQKSF